MANSTPPPQSSPLSVPVAIIAAGALIGLGLFFGLRSPPDAPSASTAAPGALPSTSAASPMPLGPGPAPTASAELSQQAPTARTAVDKKTVTAQVKAALDQHKKMIVEQCVTPSLAKKPTPNHVNLTFNFSVDANGKQLARGVSEDRVTSRADVTQCVQAKLPAIAIPPPGTSVFVEDIVWTLP